MPNCEDILATWYEGINTPPKVPDEKQSEKWYKAGQKQRRLERAIREQRRVIAGLTDEENIKNETVRLRRYQKQLREHLKENTQLRRKPEREG